MGAKIKLLFMFFLLLMVISMMVVLYQKYSQPDQAPEIVPETAAYQNWRAAQGDEFHKMLSEVVDHGQTVVDPDWTLEKDWFRYFAKKVRDLSSSDVSRLINPRVGMPELLTHPEHYRGTFVRLQGILRAGPDSKPILTNPDNMDYIVRWIVLDHATERVVYGYSSHLEPRVFIVAPAARGDTVLAVEGAGVDGFPPEGHLRLDREIVHYTAIEKNAGRDAHSDKPHHHLTGCRRAQMASNAQAHDTGTPCTLRFTEGRDAVYLEGMFLRIHDYETADRKKDGTFRVKPSALFLIKNVRWVSLETPRHLMTTLILIAAGFSLSAFLVVGYIQRRTKKEIPLQMLLLSAKRKRQAGSKPTGPSSDSKESPPPAEEPPPANPQAEEKPPGS